MPPDPTQASMIPVSVYRGHYTKPNELFGPLPGLKQGNVLCYEFELPDRFVPAKGKTRVERTFVLLDLGVSFVNPIWFKDQEENTWYADLIHLEQRGSDFICLDLFIDALIPTDGRSYRQLDLEEFAEAVDAQQLTWLVASDGLKRWQAFLDNHLHKERFPVATWSDFPPHTIKDLQALPSPLDTPVKMSD